MLYIFHVFMIKIYLNLCLAHFVFLSLVFVFFCLDLEIGMPFHHVLFMSFGNLCVLVFIVLMM
jgi:hypothetical protein